MGASHRFWWRESLAALAWLLPLLVPYAAGLYWLYVEGLLLLWMAGVTGVMLLLALGARLGRKRRAAAVRIPEADVDAAEAERQARVALQGLAADCTAADLADTRAVEALLRRALMAVSAAWHPGRRFAELRFTLPEALALLEHLSRRLQVAVHEDMPVLQHVQLAHVVQVKEGVGPMRSAWHLLRLGRLAVNPLGGLVAELRGGISQKLTPVLVDSMKATAAALLVREVGESAILLYSGRLRVPTAGAVSAIPLQPEVPEGPLTVLVAGGANSGKSSLVNALAGRLRLAAGPLPQPGELRGVSLEDPLCGPLILLECGTGSGAKEGDWRRALAEADAVLWVAAAHRADRQADQERLTAFREAFAQRRRPPLLLVLTHADRLDPAREWVPPYEISGKRAKEKSMQAARLQGAGALGVDAGRTCLVSLADPAAPWNVEELRLQLAGLLPAAQQVRAERLQTRRGRLEGIRDTAKTVPGLARRVWRSVRPGGL